MGTDKIACSPIKIVLFCVYLLDYGSLVTQNGQLRQLLSWLHSCYTMLLLKGNTLVPCFGDLFMKAWPSQAVLTHSQKAPAITNVFAVGYSVVKEQ